jgi:hypothetical protein
MALAESTCGSFYVMGVVVAVTPFRRNGSRPPEIPPGQAVLFIIIIYSL